MSFNFPASPAVNDLYPTPAVGGLPQYRWDGQKWVSTTGLAGTGAVRYDTPQSLVAGEKTQARTNIGAVDTAYVDAGDTAAVAVANNKVAKTGDTMSGALTVNAAITSNSNVQGLHVVSAGGSVWAQNSTTVGYYQFGNSGSKYLNYDGSNFVLTGGALYCGSVASSGSVTAASDVTANSGSLRANSTSGNVHVWLDDGGTNRVILYWERATGHFQISTPGGGHAFKQDGRLQVYQGYQCKAGMSGGYAPNCYNINHTSGQQLWIDLTNMGSFYFTSDYRIKKDIKPLPSTWNAIKRLKPISYTHKDFTPPVQEELQATKYGGIPFMPGDDIVRLGFFAHELQEEFGEGAATGYKDAPDAIQSPNPIMLIAALTKALQEAMTRIETLEASR